MNTWRDPLLKAGSWGPWVTSEEVRGTLLKCVMTVLRPLSSTVYILYRHESPDGQRPEHHPQPSTWVNTPLQFLHSPSSNSFFGILCHVMIWIHLSHTWLSNKSTTRPERGSLENWKEKINTKIETKTTGRKGNLEETETMYREIIHNKSLLMISKR